MVHKHRSRHVSKGTSRVLKLDSLLYISRHNWASLALGQFLACSGTPVENSQGSLQESPRQEDD